MRLRLRSLFFIGFPAIILSTGLAACEDDPILAPDSGRKQTNGSYGNIAIAPPLDSTAQDARRTTPPNPEVY